MNESRIGKFLGFLREKKEDRGLMADLRHGFSAGTQYRAWRHLAPWCELADDQERIIWQTVAAGFAIHGGTEYCGNLGVTLRKLALTGATGSNEDALKSFDARFRRLLTCNNAVEVCQRLIPVIRAAERKNIAIDFEKLFFDLKSWSDPDANVKIRWAATYWSGSVEEPAADTAGEGGGES